MELIITPKSKRISIIYRTPPATGTFETPYMPRPATSTRTRPDRYRAECETLRKGGSLAEGSSTWAKRKGLGTRYLKRDVRSQGWRPAPRSDPPCIIPFERHFKNGLSAARLLMSSLLLVDA